MNSTFPWRDGFDPFESINQVKNCLSCIQMRWDKLLVLGIWWSSLWTQAVLSALRMSKDVVVLDNIDPEYIQDVFDATNWNNTLINAISKSWETIETLSQISSIIWILLDKWIKPKDRIVVTTWNPNSTLALIASKYDLKVLDVPKDSWWRFSVFTQVGLLPLLWAWVNIDEFIRWFLSCKNDDSYANKLSSWMLKAYRDQGKNIFVLFSYNKRMEYVQAWFRQLLAESIWKNPETWITPESAFGSTDQHSVLQLYLAWPRDKYFIFLESKIEDWKYKLWDSYLSWKSFGELQNALYKWTLEWFRHNNLEFEVIEINKVDEFHLWYLLCTLCTSISMLGFALNINPYDQNAVEFWKQKALELLTK